MVVVVVLVVVVMVVIDVALFPTLSNLFHSDTGHKIINHRTC